MKKFFAMVLALCLICGATALAAPLPPEGDHHTDVRYTVKKCTDYEVTIPAEINLTLGNTAGTDSYKLEGTKAYSLDVSKINTPFGITITLTDTANGKDGDATHYLTMGGELYPYSIDYGTTDDPHSSGPVYLNTPILTWTFGSTAATSGALVAYAAPEDFKRAGEYTDQLTFTVRGREIS